MANRKDRAFLNKLKAGIPTVWRFARLMDSACYFSISVNGTGRNRRF